MANIKSAKKRVNVNNKKNAENRAVKSQIKTETIKFEAAVAQKEVESAQALLSQAVSTLDSAVSKKVIHKNTASRRKARLAKLLETVK